MSNKDFEKGLIIGMQLATKSSGGADMYAIIPMIFGNTDIVTQTTLINMTIYDDTIFTSSRPNDIVQIIIG